MPRSPVPLRALAGPVVLCLAATQLLAGCSPGGVAVGAGATVVTATQKEKGFQQVVSDAEIRIEINHLWFQASETIYREVSLQVQEGEVLLSGVVEKPEHRLEAVRLAWQAEGVRQVINEIEVGDDTSLEDDARDELITAELEAALLFDADVSSINYSIQTVNKVVYLMGVAQHQSELDRVIGHAKDIDYVRRVVSYVRLKTEQAKL